MLKKTFTLTTILLASFSLSAKKLDYNVPDYIDAHVHAVDFFQESEGLDKLIQNMDKGNISKSVILGIPVAKQWDEHAPNEPRYYMGDDAPVYWYTATDNIVYYLVNKLDKKDRKRLLPFLSGFNPNDRHAAEQVCNLLQQHPGFWQGIGEILLRHDDLTALTHGETPRPNNKAMMGIYKVAAQYNLPVLIHSNITSDRERKPIYAHEMEEALKKNPDTKIIWAHAGTSKEIERHQGKMDFLYDTIKDMLNKHDNLFIDLSWTMAHPYLINKNNEANKKWVKLVEEYPNRFILGSDVVGKFSSQPKIMHQFDPFIEALSEKTAKMVANENLLNLLPNPKKQQTSTKTKKCL